MVRRNPTVQTGYQGLCSTSAPQSHRAARRNPPKCRPCTGRRLRVHFHLPTYHSQSLQRRNNLFRHLLTSQSRLVLASRCSGATEVTLALLEQARVIITSLPKVPKATGKRVLLGDVKREHCDASAQMRPENMRPPIYNSSAVFH